MVHGVQASAKPGPPFGEVLAKNGFIQLHGLAAPSFGLFKMLGRYRTVARSTFRFNPSRKCLIEMVNAARGVMHYAIILMRGEGSLNMGILAQQRFVERDSHSYDVMEYLSGMYVSMYVCNVMLMLMLMLM